MCKSTADGGQRCIGHATAKMVKAQDRYETALGHATATEGKGGHPLFVRKAQVAFDKFDAARIEYASTPQGEEDLKNRLQAALDGRGADTGARTPDGKPLDNPVDLETAIVAGRLMRKRNERRRERNAATRTTTPATRRAPAAPSVYTPAAAGEIVRITKGTADNGGTAYLPEGAYVRFHGQTTDYRGNPVLDVERVRMPGDMGDDELDMGYGRSHNGSRYRIPVGTVGPAPDGDKTAAYFTANPTAFGDDYNGDEYDEWDHYDEDAYASGL